MKIIKLCDSVMLRRFGTNYLENAISSIVINSIAMNILAIVSSSTSTSRSLLDIYKLIDNNLCLQWTININSNGYIRSYCW